MASVSVYLTFAPEWWKLVMTVVNTLAWLLVLYIGLVAVRAFLDRLSDGDQ
jgi:hypothetical protein